MSMDEAQIRSKAWDLIVPVVEAEGFRVFDIEVPTSGAGTLKVFIWRGPKTQIAAGAAESGVLLDDCARISKAIDLVTELDETIPGRYVLEVSSPGVNRKLVTREHVADAVGERLKVVIDYSVVPKGTVYGVLKAFDGERLSITDEDNDQLVEFPFVSMRRARVDFKFGN